MGESYSSSYFFYELSIRILKYLSINFYNINYDDKLIFSNVKKYKTNNYKLIIKL